MGCSVAYDVNRRPAGFVRRRANRERRGALLFGALLLVAVVFSVGLLVAGTSGIVPAAALLAVVLVARQFTLDRFEAGSPWEKGANGEEAVGELLNELRGEGYIVMHDLENVVNGNVDHLVSGPSGVFMVETKFRRYQDPDIPKAKRVAAKLGLELGVWVTPVICFATRSYGPRAVRGVAVLGREQLLPFLRSQRKPTVSFDRLVRLADRQ